MTRGTTPLLEFGIPFDTSIITDLYITISQARKPVIEKTLSDCTVSDGTIAVKLTQEDTLKLCGDIKAEIQIRCKVVGGDAYASNIITCSAERILKDGEI